MAWTACSMYHPCMRWFIIIVVVFLFGANASAEQPITVAFGESAPNHFMVDEKPAGLLFGVGDAAFRRAGFVPVYQTRPWARLYAELAEGAVDAAIGVFAVGEDRKKALYSAPIMVQFPVLIARRDDHPAIKRIEDLYGRKIGGRLGLSYNTLINHQKIEILRARNDKLNVKKLLAGRIDFAIVGSVTGLYSLATQGILPDVDVVASIDEIPLGLALADERFDAEDLDMVNKA